MQMRVPKINKHFFILTLFIWLILIYPYLCGKQIPIAYESRLQRFERPDGILGTVVCFPGCFLGYPIHIIAILMIAASKLMMVAKIPINFILLVQDDENTIPR